MLPQEAIRRKRDGDRIADADIAAFVRGLTNGEVGEGQAAAFAMAVFFRGMAPEETVALTRAMRDSGTVLTWDLPGPVVDKHSTGGIGDNVSLMLAPMLAAAGCYVPMISGRGLGHTGGTLDKLDSIPGYNTAPGLDLFRKVVKDVGCAIIGQTADLAPADRRLYAIRDVTATVESVPLITASILSKKLAAGLQYLVLDVKTGSGAFMAGEDSARHLAQSLVTVANGAGLKTTALVTDMDEPLASVAGNSLEMRNAVDYLTGEKRDSRLHDVTVALGVTLLDLCGMNNSRKTLETALASGAAAEHFARMVAVLGGPKDFIDRIDTYLPAAAIARPVHAQGTVSRIATRDLGLAVIELGGGRRLATDGIDHAVGLSNLAGKGDEVGRDRPLCFIHARDESSFARVENLVRMAYQLGEAPPKAPVVRDRIGPMP